MNKENVEIKSKGKVLETAVYESPETLEEGLKADGKEKVFKLYTMQRKIRFADSRRRALTGGGVTSGMAKALKKATPDKLAKILALLGDDANPDLKAAVDAMTQAAAA